MDRISALRNVEDALSEFERGEIDLASMEQQIQAVLRTYATDFEDERTAVYRVDPIEDRAVVIVANSPGEARDRAAAQVGGDCEHADVERLGGDH
ncbi:hypothetical protein L593_12690 [Salinarchaeum sp. Harcht-Bsk1]|uniref:DUF7854 family protein n=1 Tax=Salinarchaeum sp. Harcht-Bsk1 TaxID=1333523 RepID=UPI0003422B1D|nr:hypothetical protein [Salinarchaeum sp. Harcht-Bsk1]AGN02477.1 hypothetical protein L593_12690 [Salinarchaeum sp. Harcht-Bsk1]